MIYTAIGSSQNSKPQKAFEEAYSQLVTNLNGQLPNLIFCFSNFSSEQIQPIAQQIKDQSPQALLVGQYTHAFIKDKNFSIILYSLSSQNIQLNTKILPTQTSPDASPPDHDHAPQQTLYFIANHSSSLNNFLETLNKKSHDIPIIGSISYHPSSWVLLNTSSFTNMILQIDLNTFNLLSINWNNNLPIGLPQAYTCNNNTCELIGNQPAIYYYQKYLSLNLESLSKDQQLNLFSTYPLYFQGPKHVDIISPINLINNQLILPINPNPNCTSVSLSLENPDFPIDTFIEKLTTIQVSNKHTPLLFTTAYRDCPTFINEKEDELLTNHDYPELLKISTHGLITSNNLSTIDYSSQGRLLINIP